LASINFSSIQAATFPLLNPDLAMQALASPQIAPILMLMVSNVFMTIAWYGHLRFPAASIVVATIVSWGIAFIEYCFVVPANRIGYEVYSTAQLKTIQEVTSLTVFVGFSITVLGETLSAKQLGGFALLAAGAWLIFDAG
jgi:uncharacterized protein